MKNYPVTTNVETVNDGAESALFKQLFQMWTVKDQTQGLGKVHSRGKVGTCAFTFTQKNKRNGWRVTRKQICIICWKTLAVARITQGTFDASLLHVMPEVAAQERMVDDGTGQAEV